MPATTLRAGARWTELPSVPIDVPWGLQCVGDLDGDGVPEVRTRHRVLSGRPLVRGESVVIPEEPPAPPEQPPLDAFGLPLPDPDPIESRAAVLPGWGSVVWSGPVDVDGDGNEEHGFVRRGPPAELVLFPGTERCCTNPALIVEGFLTGDLLALDLDGDGVREIVASEPRTPAVWVWSATLDGRRLRREDALATLRTYAMTIPLALDDLDGDDLPDLALFTPDLEALTQPMCGPPASRGRWR